tara:strand:- start:135 stop:500 length:366 start_codon:yes stop_codon:yes gene_type:complete
MKNLQTFSEFINESTVNERDTDVRTLADVIKVDKDGRKGYEEIAKILNAKPEDVLLYDGDDHYDSKEYKKYDKLFMTRGRFKGTDKAPEFSDMNMANVAHDKKENVVSSYGGGKLDFFATK